MEKSHISVLSSNNRGKLVKGIISRQLHSPFRSSKVKRILNYTSQPPLLHKFSKYSPIRSRVSPNRACLSDLQPLRTLISPNISTSDSVQSKYNSNFPEESLNFVQTPSTIKEEDPLTIDLIDESLSNYFNFEVNSHYFNATPIPSMITPDVRIFHRYKNSLPLEINPHRSETPEIPTRRKGENQQVKLPCVEKKFKPSRENRKNRSPSPMEYISKNRGKIERNRNLSLFTKNKVK